MKSKILIITFTIIISILFIIILNNQNIKTFNLDNKYYKKNLLEEIDTKKLNKLLNDKESFGIFVYQPMCFTSTQLNTVISDFQKKNKLSFYKISFSNIKNTSIEKYLKYSPSFIIYKKGKMIDFLEADKNEDIEYYKTADGFTNWFTKYVKLKN